MNQTDQFVSKAIELQRNTLENSQRAMEQAVGLPLQQSVALQRNAAQLMLDGLEIGNWMSSRSVEFTRDALDSYLDTVESAARDTSQLTERGIQSAETAGQRGLDSTQQFAPGLAGDGQAGAQPNGPRTGAPPGYRTPAESVAASNPQSVPAPAPQGAPTVGTPTEAPGPSGHAQPSAQPPQPPAHLSQPPAQLPQPPAQSSQPSQPEQSPTQWTPNQQSPTQEVPIQGTPTRQGPTQQLSTLGPIQDTPLQYSDRMATQPTQQQPPTQQAPTQEGPTQQAPHQQAPTGQPPQGATQVGQLSPRPQPPVATGQAPIAESQQVAEQQPAAEQQRAIEQPPSGSVQDSQTPPQQPAVVGETEREGEAPTDGA